MHRECRERFPRHRIQRKPLICDPSMHHDTCVTHAPWCMSVSLTHGGGENVPGIPGACTTSNFTYLVRGPCNYHKMTSWHGNTLDITSPLIGESIGNRITPSQRASNADFLLLSYWASCWTNGSVPNDLTLLLDCICLTTTHVLQDILAVIDVTVMISIA